MKIKNSRLEALKMLLSNLELSSQDEVLKALNKQGFKLTQATLSRDMKQLKVAKAASTSGKYIYVLPSETTYKRVTTSRRTVDARKRSGYLSIRFAGHLAIIKTRPGCATSLAYELDNSDLPEILGTIAGYDTVFLATKEGYNHREILRLLSYVIPEIESDRQNDVQKREDHVNMY